MQLLTTQDSVLPNSTFGKPEKKWKAEAQLELKLVSVCVRQ